MVSYSPESFTSGFFHSFTQPVFIGCLLCADSVLETGCDTDGRAGRSSSGSPDIASRVEHGDRGSEDKDQHPMSLSNSQT